MRESAVSLQQQLADPNVDPEQIRDLADELAGQTLKLSYMLSEPDWGVGMLEDIAAIVGLEPNPDNEPRWDRH